MSSATRSKGLEVDEGCKGAQGCFPEDLREAQSTHSLTHALTSPNHPGQ